MTQALLNLFLLGLLSCLSYLIPSTFYPEIAKEKGCSIQLIGFIMAIYPIGGGITSIYLGKTMKTLGRKNLIQKGGKLLSLSFFLFALCI